jgi:hypothetical protein
MSHLVDLARVSVDRGVFRRAVAQRLRTTFAFLMLLVLVSSLAGTISAMRGLRDLARRIDPYLDQLPTVTIRNGKASADVPQPWVKRFDRERGRDLVLIIDTTGRRTDFAPDEYGLFVQREQLILKSDDQRREISLSQVPDMDVGPSTVRAAIAKVLRRAPFYIGAFLLLYFFFMKLVQSLFLVLPALAGASGRKPPLGFGALFTIAVYALAPAVLLDCVLDFLPFTIPHFWLIYVAVAAVYAFIGARAATSETDPGDSTSVPL